MRRSPLLASVVAAALCAVASPALEGKWTPQQLASLDRAALAREGLAIPPEALWDEAAREGLLLAVVDLDGCTGALLSADGLLATNHHCVMGILQQHGGPAHDLIGAGFLAADRQSELDGAGTVALLPSRFRDVTADVDAVARLAVDDRSRAVAITRKGKELVAACEKAPGRRCQVAPVDGGVRYTLVESLEYPDVRLVYAPPQAVGDFGGEVDNWMWPRHTGDFALLRIWAAADGTPARPAKGNLPLRSPHHLRLATRGVGPGDLVVTAGYPGSSFRSLTAAEMGERAALVLPQRVELYRAWLKVMEAAAATDEAAALALADRIKSLANSEKAARGQIAGLTRGSIVERKWDLESQIVAWAQERVEEADAVTAYQGLAAIVEARRDGWRRDILLEAISRGPQPVAAALTLVQWAHERARPDIERTAGYMERDRTRLKEGLLQGLKRTHVATEKALMVAIIERMAALPATSRSAAVDRLLIGTESRAAIAGRVDVLFAASRVPDEGSVRTMFDENVAGLRLRRDPLLELAFAVDDELRVGDQRRQQDEGASARLRPRWQKAVQDFLGTPIAPDANGTLRVSFGKVMGYSPRDGVTMLPQTRLAGMLEKDTGSEPFVLPAALRTAAASGAGSAWSDPRLGDVPVAFLADLDTSTGMSGSPVLNGAGELVGLNFDRVWENVANDFGYREDVNRNISLDARFMLFYLDVVEAGRAAALLAELGVTPSGR